MVLLWFSLWPVRITLLITCFVKVRFVEISFIYSKIHTFQVYRFVRFDKHERPKSSPESRYRVFQ